MNWNEEYRRTQKALDESAPGELPKARHSAVQLTIIAFFIPLVCILCLFLWSVVQGHVFSNREIRLACMIIWALTMGILAIAAIGGRHGKRRRAYRDIEPSLEAANESGSEEAPEDHLGKQLARWDNKSSRRTILQVASSVIFVPLLAFVLVAVHCAFIAQPMNAEVITTIAPILWIGGILSGIFTAVRSTRSTLIYTT